MRAYEERVGRITKLTHASVPTKPDEMPIKSDVQNLSVRAASDTSVDEQMFFRALAEQKGAPWACRRHLSIDLFQYTAYRRTVPRVAVVGSFQLIHDASDFVHDVPPSQGGSGN